MIDDIIDQKIALSFVYERIVYSRSGHEVDNSDRDLDILYGHVVHGIPLAELGREYGISKSRASKSFVTTKAKALATIRVNMPEYQ